MQPLLPPPLAFKRDALNRWNRLSGHPWRRSCRRALAPASGVALGLALLLGWPVAAPARVAPVSAGSSSSLPSDLQLEAAPQLALVRYNRRRYQRPAWGAPRWSYGGAARGGCSPAEPPVVPLVPVDDQDPTTPSFLGLTGSAYPSLLVYVPPTTAQAVELLVLDENQDQSGVPGEIVYQKQIVLTQSPGIVKFDLAAAQTPGEAVKALVEDRHYTWTVSLVCDPLDPSGNPFVNGLMQRVATTDGTALAAADPYDRINRYAEAGLWHETVAALGDLYCQRPEDGAVASDWRDLLFSLNLTNAPELVETVQTEDIASAPLLWCEGGQ